MGYIYLPQPLPPSPTKLARLLHGFLQVITWNRAFSLKRPAATQIYFISIVLGHQYGGSDVVWKCSIAIQHG